MPLHAVYIQLSDCCHRFVGSCSLLLFHVTESGGTDVCHAASPRVSLGSLASPFADCAIRALNNNGDRTNYVYRKLAPGCLMQQSSQRARPSSGLRQFTMTITSRLSNKNGPLSSLRWHSRQNSTTLTSPSAAAQVILCKTVPMTSTRLSAAPPYLSSKTSATLAGWTFPSRMPCRMQL